MPEEEKESLLEDSPFNVRGLLPQYKTDDDYLLDVLKLGFKVADWTTADAYRIDKRLGLVLYWSDTTESGEHIHKFITPQTAEQIHPQVEAFLASYYNGEIEIELEDSDREVTGDSDITNVPGYRVYTGRWGRVDEDSYAFLAIKPAYDCYSK